ncbi:hypothetical protein CC117_30825 [Parafrankia colletiae]|uniref:Uncharacterized protein n=1 Tax=Parafrankia colletiae TaxID=573497 RepID=A0A1S1Q2Z0_9ACTN|nr:hypothetical protein [Parafrankia colletiae]MCK9904580.1 hypothetical protein [Frankia sp. Cpl3]OHV27949.1 hypothetical protein CC117_30825 [Parafrankia colletiae]
MSRRFLVFDGDGELVGAFAAWEDAHAWAHLRSAEPATIGPVQVEDRDERRTWTMDGGDHCRLTVWRRHVEYGYCAPSSPEPVPPTTFVPPSAPPPGTVGPRPRSRQRRQVIAS